MTPDWRLPPGVSRGVWEYAHDSSVATNYDAELADSPLLRRDFDFVQRWLTTPRRVIDLGCGTGRIAIPLAQAGHQVVAIDLSESMLRVAQGKENSQSVSWLCGNIAELSSLRDQSFDAATCLFSTLGMIAGDPGRTAVIQEAFRLLRLGGTLLLHAHNLHHLLGTAGSRRLWLRNLGRILFQRSQCGDFEMPAAPGRSSWAMHLFTRREIGRLLTINGFVIDELQTVGIDGRPRKWPVSATAYGFLIAARKAIA